MNSPGITESKFLVAVAILALGKPVIVAFVSQIAGAFALRQGELIRRTPTAAQLLFEKRSIALVLTDPIALVLLQLAGAFRLSPDTLVSLVVTAGAMFVWVDFWMYANHVAMHRIPMFIRWHSHHHASLVPQATSALSFSFMEKTMCYTLPWMCGAAALSWFLPISLLGLTFFYVFYFFSSAIAHANVEMLHPKADPARFSVLGSSTSHALHHAQPGKNFAFFTTIYDRIFGTAATAADYRAMSAMRPES